MVTAVSDAPIFVFACNINLLKELREDQQAMIKQFTNEAVTTWEPEDVHSPAKLIDILTKCDGSPCAADVVCHEEQLRLWAEEVTGAIGGYIRDDMSYDDVIDLGRIVEREIKSIVETFEGAPKK